MSDDWKATIIGIAVWSIIVIGSVAYGVHSWCVLETGKIYEARCSVGAARDELESALDCVDADDKDRYIENALEDLANVGE